MISKVTVVAKDQPLNDENQWDPNFLMPKARHRTAGFQKYNDDDSDNAIHNTDNGMNDDNGNDSTAKPLTCEPAESEAA